MEQLMLVHPGEILKEEFLVPLSISAYRLAKDIGVPQTRISEIIREKRSVTADTALRLAKYFDSTSEFWLNLQTSYDLRKAALDLGQEIKSIPHFQRPLVSSKVNQQHT